MVHIVTLSPGRLARAFARVFTRMLPGQLLDGASIEAQVDVLIQRCIVACRQFERVADGAGDKFLDISITCSRQCASRWRFGGLFGRFLFRRCIDLYGARLSGMLPLPETIQGSPFPPSFMCTRLLSIDRGVLALARRRFHCSYRGVVRQPGSLSTIGGSFLKKGVQRALALAARPFVKAAQADAHQPKPQALAPSFAGHYFAVKQSRS